MRLSRMKRSDLDIFGFRMTTVRRGLEESLAMMRDRALDLRGASDEWAEMDVAVDYAARASRSLERVQRMVRKELERREAKKR